MPHKLLLADDSVTIQRVVQLTFVDEDIEVVTVGTVVGGKQCQRPGGWCRHGITTARDEDLLAGQRLQIDRPAGRGVVSFLRPGEYPDQIVPEQWGAFGQDVVTG